MRFPHTASRQAPFARFCSILVLLTAGCRNATPPQATTASPSVITPSAARVDRLDPSLDSIVPAGAEVQKLATGFTWVEGPVWIKQGYLLFAEITSNSIRRWSPDTGATIFLQPSGYRGSAPFHGPEPGSNGMTLDPHGRLMLAGHGGRNIWRLESLSPTARQTVLVDSYRGKLLNSPNDLVYKSDGSLYFTDPPYGLPSQADSDPGRQLTVNGVYRLPGAASHQPGAPPDRDQLQLLIKDLPRPNGIAFSPDEKFLYVTDSGPKKIWMRYRVQPDGSVTEGKVFFDATSDTRPGSPDGIKVDQKGNLYGVGPGGVWIFSPEGKHLGTVLIPELAANVAWGDADGKTLYVTATHSIYRVHLMIPGVLPGEHQ